MINDNKAYNNTPPNTKGGMTQAMIRKAVMIRVFILINLQSGDCDVYIHQSLLLDSHGQNPAT